MVFISHSSPPPLCLALPLSATVLVNASCRASSTWSSKLFEASRKLIPAQDAVVFPNMEASSLAGGADVDFPSRLKGRVTLVGLFHRQFGYNMLPTWTEPFEEAFGVPGECQQGYGERCRRRLRILSIPEGVVLRNMYARNEGCLTMTGWGGGGGGGGAY